MSSQIDRFTGYRIHRIDGRIEARFDTLRLEDLSAGEVVIEVSHSSINYKDALAATGAGSILRRYPLVGGIDLAGRVIDSSVSSARVGDTVLVHGSGLSETRDGGYARYARVPADAVVPLPAGFDASMAMAVGTAGFSAALAIDRMEHNGQRPDQGPIVVTGASGGVGSVAVDLLAARGYQVVAVSSKPDMAGYLRALGAAEVIAPDQLTSGDQPLLTARWGGAIDNVGGALLGRLLAATRTFGNVASIGMAASAQLSTTVMPFILRGVNLLGITSNNMPQDQRRALWQRIGADLRPPHLDRILTRTLAFDELPSAFAGYLRGGVHGRTVVRIGD